MNALIPEPWRCQTLLSKPVSTNLAQVDTPFLHTLNDSPILKERYFSRLKIKHIMTEKVAHF